MFRRKGNLDDKPQVIQLLCPLINFGRCCGVIPLKRCDNEPYFERCLGSYCWGLVLFTIYVFRLVTTFWSSQDWSDRSTINIVSVIGLNVNFYLHCNFTLIFFMLRSNDLVQLFQLWIDLERTFTRNNIHLGLPTKRKCWLIYFASGILFTIDYINYFYRSVNCFQSISNLNVSYKLKRFIATYS